VSDVGGGQGPPLPDFHDLASRVTRTRSDFGRVYDEVRAAVPTSRPFIAVSAGATSDQVAFERALRLANEEGWLTQLGVRLIHDGFLPDQSTAVTALQALIKADLGFPDAVQVERGGLRARQRLCRVEVAIDGNPEAITGTGFLVGPSTVLTAYHVVSSLVDAAGVATAGSERRLKVRFDFATGRYGAMRTIVAALDRSTLLHVVSELEQRSVFWPADLTARTLDSRLRTRMTPSDLTGLIEMADRCGLAVDLIDAVSAQGSTHLSVELAAGIRRIEGLLFPYARTGSEPRLNP
jgi:hypothetical protein